MSDNTSLIEALAQLQSAQVACVNALQKIEEHNIDESAHADIREILEKILNSDTVYTRDQIAELVTTGIEKHTDADFKTAHAGFTEYDDEIQKKLTELVGRVQSIEAWMKGTTDDGTVTNLTKAIQAVEDEYATKLSNLSTSYQLAIANEDTELATEITNRITELMQEKNTKILDIIAQYGETNTVATE